MITVAREGKITRNFAWDETAVSAQFPDLADPVPDEFQQWAEKLAVMVLQPIREREGRMTPISWYRSPALNAAVGGGPTSQHLRAQAVDVTMDDIRGAFTRLVACPYVPCGQVIYYPRKNFLHIALPGARYPEPTFFVSTTPKVYRPVSSIAAIDRLWPLKR